MDPLRDLYTRPWHQSPTLEGAGAEKSGVGRIEERGEGRRKVVLEGVIKSQKTLCLGSIKVVLMGLELHL